MDKPVKIHPNERVDFIQRKGYKIIQNPEVFCFGIDAVLLADFTKAKKKDHVLDIGTGTGIIPILMYARYENMSYTGIDVQEDMIHMANRSVYLNGIEDHIKMVHLNVKDLIHTYPENSFDIVTSNPPYMKGQAGLVNENESKMISRHEITCSLEDIIQNAAYVLKDKGKLAMIHRPHRLVDIICLMRQYRIEPKRMRMIHPKEGKAPTMVLIEGIKYARAELIVEAPLYVYNTSGQYTDEIYKIYGTEKEDN
ncbi:MAG TPA: tRNA1(Val) (adenine(37)-N6)-methyltransferase [Epulopiscium sp.]|nr:tRNA1(Val) (adenine(37)-N6)-methyltransferase [Candidatus Epulonipiscium sp.]